MLKTSFKRHSGNLRRALKHPAGVGGHFVRHRVYLDNFINGEWTALYNTRTKRLIVLYQERNGVLVVMMRQKSPYRTLITEQLKQAAGAAFIWRNMPISTEVRQLNADLSSLRGESKASKLANIERIKNR